MRGIQEYYLISSYLGRYGEIDESRMRMKRSDLDCRRREEACDSMRRRIERTHGFLGRGRQGSSNFLRGSEERSNDLRSRRLGRSDLRDLESERIGHRTN